MPRIEKVRITGVRYDKMKKHYENTLFDFINDESPQHALMTLVNGGGKGMLLQMIFQVLMPLTTWGKNGENHIDALFYNEKQQFDPYTFHVALEWRLDTEPAEWLVTGICVTARKSGQENDEVETEPQHFLYTSKYRKPDDWTIETLPLYDEEQRHTTSYEEWENWLKKHKQQFQFYSRSKQHAYFQYLSSYGIEKAEWRQMKEINRDEGGIEHYFKKGLDNFGLFHHLIIPEISAYLEEDQEENLVKIFRDNSIIAQKLPKLLKREEAYGLIHEKLVPLKTALEEGKSLETEVQEHHDRSNYLFYGMEEQKQTYRFEQDKWEEEKQKTLNHQADFLWQKDNLDYAKECRNLEDISNQIDFIKSRVNELEMDEKTLEGEKHSIQVDMALKEYSESTQMLVGIEARIQMLENTRNLKEEKEQTEQIEQALTENWKSIEKEILADIEKYNTLETQLKKQIKTLRSHLNLEQHDLNGVRAKIGTFTDTIKTHNQNAISMEQTYGREINRDPESVHRKLSKELHELETTLMVMQKEMEGLQTRLGEVREQFGENRTLFKGKNEDLKKIQIKKEARIQEEKSFHRSWSHYFFSDQEFQFYTSDDWMDLAEQLHKEELHLKSQLETIQKEFWYHQLDTSLVNGEYWIANHDIRRMVEKLAEENVPATYGTQLIQEMTKEEQAVLLMRYPFLAFGVVVHQHDWERKIDQASFQTMLAHSPVPIFIRERMNQEYAQPFEIVFDQGIVMAFHPEKWIQWKGNLANLTEGFTADLETVQSKLADVKQMIETVKILSVTPFQELLNEEEEIKDQFAELDQEKKQLEEEIWNIDSTLKKLGKQIEQSQQNSQSCRLKLQAVELWVQAFKQFIETQKLKADAQRKETKLVDRINQLTSEQEEQEKSLASWESTYRNWKISSEHQTHLLKEAIPTIKFPASNAIHTGEEVTPQFRNTIFETVGVLLKRWQTLQQKMNSVDSELASEKTRREYQLQDQEKKRELLNSLDSSWVQRNVPIVPIGILKEKLQLKEVAIKKVLEQLLSERGNVKGLHGQKIQLEKNKSKQEGQILKKHHRAAEVWSEINLEEKDQEIEEQLNRIRADLSEQEEILMKLIAGQQQLQKQQDILRSHLPSFKQVGEVPDAYKENIKRNPGKLIEQWIGQNNQYKERKEQYHKGFKERLKELTAVLQSDKIDGPLRNSLNQLIPQLESDSIRSGLSVISSVMEFIQNELIKLKDDKQKAEEAQEIWVDRAVIRVIRIFQSLKQMVNRMKVKNQEGHIFPLVEIERLKEIETADEEDYRRLLREHFTQTIEKLLETEEAIENLTEYQLKNYIDDNQLVLVSLRNRYPKLAIYKPQTTNAFLFEKPRKHHYTDWETLNKGSKMEAKGSGGQLLAARTMIMMMIMTFKRQEHSNNWSVLITDNPFGQAVSAHILDPIFSIADILRFQWIVLAPPELIKLDVSRRFPVYWKLELSQQKQGEVIKEVLHHGGRTFDEVEFSLF